MFFNGLLALTLRLLLVWENRKLDRKWGTVAEQDTRAAIAVGVHEGKAGNSVVGNENYGPRYRYVL